MITSRFEQNLLSFWKAPAPALLRFFPAENILPQPATNLTLLLCCFWEARKIAQHSRYYFNPLGVKPFISVENCADSLFDIHCKIENALSIKRFSAEAKRAVQTLPQQLKLLADFHKMESKASSETLNVDQVQLDLTTDQIGQSIAYSIDCMGIAPYQESAARSAAISVGLQSFIESLPSNKPQLIYVNFRKGFTPSCLEEPKPGGAKKPGKVIPIGSRQPSSQPAP